METLSNLLQGLSAGPMAVVSLAHFCFASSGGGIKPTEVHVLTDLATKEWCVQAPRSRAAFLTQRLLSVVRHQSRFLTTERTEKLGAAVREVLEARVQSGDAATLLKAMGCTLHYQVRRRGVRFRLLVAGLPVDVLLVLLELQTGKLVPGHWLVEASCRTTEETYPAAVAALMTAAERLSGHVQLCKPETGLGPR